MMSGLAFGGGRGGSQPIATYDLSVDTLGTGNEIDLDVTGCGQVHLSLINGAISSAESVICYFSANGGSSFRSTSGDYKITYFNTIVRSAEADATEIFVAGGASGTSQFISETTIRGLNQAGHAVTSVGMLGSNADTYQMHHRATNLEAVDTLRITTSDGGDMTSGMLVIYAS